MRFYIHKLGCPKNDVDADYISTRLTSEGHERVDSAEQAEVVIVNTCGFILPAREESINELLRLGQLKAGGTVKRLYASGCLSQRYGDELLEGMPELDGTFGVGALDDLSSAVGAMSRFKQTKAVHAGEMSYINWDRRGITDDFPYAYLKISDGCNRTCAYCAIPSIRGHYRSRPLQSIVNEARYLADNGKRELVLVSQEATLYGHDLKDGSNLLTVLRELEKIESLRWIRLLYLYPTQITDELIDHMTSPDTKTLDYFDIPLQHINDDVLRAMQRRMTRQAIESVLARIRQRCPEGTIRTTFIVGFPGETGERFEELAEYVTAADFDRLGVFTYSPEEGTPAEPFGDPIPDEVKAGRMDELMTRQLDIVVERNNSLIGSVKEVIIDSITGENTAVGRTRADCPEIDQEVLVTGENLTVGDICPVRVKSVDGYDLVGTKLEG